MKLNRKAPMKKKWPRYCFYAAMALILLAVILYFVYCQSINSEFGYAENYFGESFDELYSLSFIDGDIIDPIVSEGEEALRTIGAGENFGKLSRYCIEPDSYPDAVRVDAEIDTIAAGTDGDSGYIWVAYHQKAYNEDGSLATASGTEDSRILARWSIGKIDGAWTVTEIKEAP